MQERLSVLRATARVLRPGGRTVFSLIRRFPGSTAEVERRDVGPTFATEDLDLADQMRAAGLSEVEEVDVTAEYRETAAAWLEHTIRLQGDLVEVWGEETMAEELQRRQSSLAAIDDGLLIRTRFVATG